MQPLPGGSGSISASTDKDAYPPLELSVAAIKSDGSVTTESFKPCQSLPEEWTRLQVLLHFLFFPSLLSLTIYLARG